MKTPTNRPLRRGDCVAGPRPCPWVTCRHHLLPTIGHGGGLRLVGDLDVDDVLADGPEADVLLATALQSAPETCSLDVADRGDHTLREVGEVLQVTRERTRQIEVSGLLKLRRLPKSLLHALLDGLHHAVEARS